MLPTPAALLREARLYLEWTREAAGPWLVAGEPGPGTSLAAAARAPMPPHAAPQLGALAQTVAACVRCSLSRSRTQTVFGEGPTRPRLVVVGEAPGAEEDASGRPFVGAAGRLLTRMLSAIGLAREEVYICNLLKCRPPGNRNPQPDEVASCKPYLVAQLEALSPELILALGSPASRELLRTERGITSLRGRLARTPEGWAVLPTYHPAYLLRRPEAKREAWEDLKLVARQLGLTLP